MPAGKVTIKSAAEVLRVSVATLRHWDKKGVLKAERDDHNHYRLYRISDLEKFKAARRSGGRPRAKLTI